MFCRCGISLVILVFWFCSLSQSAPIPIVHILRRESWNPYYHPTVRSLSLPPPTLTSALPSSRRIEPLQYTGFLKNIDRRAINPQASISNFTNTSTVLKFDFDLGNVTAINLSLNEFIKSAEEIIRELLIATQTSLLRIIGQVDKGADRFQKDLQGHLFSLILAGQMTTAEVRHALPPFLRSVIERLRTSQDKESREMLSSQLAQALQNLRKLKKQLREAFAEHEIDFHNVFQERFTQINQYLRVPELPRRQFGWYDNDR